MTADNNQNVWFVVLSDGCMLEVPEKVVRTTQNLTKNEKHFHRQMARKQKPNRKQGVQGSKR